MSDYFLYLIVRFIGFILRLMPISASLWLGRRTGDLAYYFKRDRRKLALINLKAALGSNYTYKNLQGITKKTFQNLGQTLVEIINFPRIDINYLNKYVTFENLNYINRALKKGNGVMHLTAHFGNWELSSFAASLKGYHIRVFAREQKHRHLNQLLNQYRELSGCRVIRKGMALRELIRGLHNNEIIGMLGDQNAGASGIQINFFNRLASTASGAIALALKTKAVLLPSFIIRERNIYHRIIVETPLELEDTGNTDLDIKNGLEKFNILLEKYVVKNPEQWLWLHKRWKKTPNRTLLILSDGKAGHQRQSAAVSRIGAELSSPDLINIKLIEVKFKNKLAKTLLPVFNILGNLNLLGSRIYFKWALGRDKFLELEKTFTDIVISCGSSLALLNLWLTQENKAKSVIIMKPPLISLKKFNLAIVPSHDHPKESDNIVVSLGPPTGIKPEDLAEKAQLLKNKFKLSPKPKIGILLGGNNRRYYFSKDDLEKLIDQVIKISSSLDLGLLVTTSRRTPKTIENLLKERLTNFKNCELLVIANENNFPGAVEGILGLSQVIITSSESISMICEAASCGKPVIAFEPRRKKISFLFGADKQKLLLRQLIEKGYVAASDISCLPEIIKEQKSSKILDNQAEILNGLRRIW